jgi:hypothetical protein
MMIMMTTTMMIVGVWQVFGRAASEYLVGAVSVDQCWHSAVMFHFPGWISLFKIGF